MVGRCKFRPINLICVTRAIQRTNTFSFEDLQKIFHEILKLKFYKLKNGIALDEDLSLKKTKTLQTYLTAYRK